MGRAYITYNRTVSIHQMSSEPGIDKRDLLTIMNALPEGSYIDGIEQLTITSLYVPFRIYVNNEMFADDGKITLLYKRNMGFDKNDEIKSFNEFRGLDLSEALRVPGNNTGKQLDK